MVDVRVLPFLIPCLSHQQVIAGSLRIHETRLSPGLVVQRLQELARGDALSRFGTNLNLFSWGSFQDPGQFRFPAGSTLPTPLPLRRGLFQCVCVCVCVRVLFVHGYPLLDKFIGKPQHPCTWAGPCRLLSSLFGN